MRKYNWKPDLPHKRDKYKHYEANQPARDVDLRVVMPPVVDQGDIGSCTGNGLAAAYGFLEIQELPGKSGPEQFKDGKFDPVSRLFIYWNERTLEGDTFKDDGAQIRDGIKTLQQWGACRESTWPYDPAKLYKCPSRRSYGEAFNHKELFSYRLDNTKLENLLGCLNEGFPFVFGVTLYDSFESDKAANTGVIPMPDVNIENVVGGHCMVCVGCDLTMGHFIIRNSWGESWGDKGYCYMPFSYLTDGDLADDFWTLRRS